MQEISDWLRPVHKDLQRGKFVLVDDQQDKESSAPVVDGKNLVAEKKVKKADKLKSALRKQLKHFLVGKDDWLNTWQVQDVLWHPACNRARYKNKKIGLLFK